MSHGVKKYFPRLWGTGISDAIFLLFYFSVTSIRSKINCNLKTIAFREFCINMLFSYFWASYNSKISNLHTRVIATLRLSLLSKSIRT